MFIPKEDLYHFFKSKNINYLYHANTVGTACTFIENGGLLSRGFVERNSLFQTFQKSDEDDKKFGVWDDIFLDIVDLHGYFPRQNLYGPVLFVYKTEVLLSSYFHSVRITKNNPIYWDIAMNDIDKYFSSVEEYRLEYEANVKCNKIQAKMITIPKLNGPLDFTYLEKIVLDDPCVHYKDTIYFDQAYQLITDSLKSCNISTNILHIRKCINCINCYCHKNYLNAINIKELYRLFIENGL